MTSFNHPVEWPRGHFVVAVSGGVDSVSLLDLLVNQAPAARLEVAHFNHGIRADADLDAELVRALAQVYNLPFHSRRANLAGASEAQARAARYAFLEEVKLQTAADGIITAHHLDDSHETTAINALRGAAGPGLSGFGAAGVYRPLRLVRKQELIDYARAKGLPWREDATNADTTLLRNFVRREMLPTAWRELPGLDRQYSWLVSEIDQLHRQLDHRLGQLLGAMSVSAPGRLVIDRRALARWPLDFVGQLVALALRRCQPGIQLSTAKIAELALLIKTGRAGQAVPVAGQLKLELEYAKVAITFFPAEPEHVTAQLLHANTSLQFGRHLLAYGRLDTASHPGIPVFPADFRVRTHRPGDRVALKSGRKKLQDLFVDQKIGRIARRQWPVVVTAQDEVVWVPGLAANPNLRVQAPADTVHYLTHELT